MEPKRNKNYIAGIYLRLSRDDERAGESLSIENQKILVTKYVKEKGWEIKDVYVDDGYSGTNFERPGVKRLLDDAKAGEINTIVVKDLSRFGRNYILVGQYIDYVFPSFGIRFIAIEDRIDTASKDTSAMDMMPIMNVFNEWHSANTRKKIRAVKYSCAQAGKYLASKAPYGYVRKDDKNHTPIIDEEAAPGGKADFRTASQRRKCVSDCSGFAGGRDFISCRVCRAQVREKGYGRGA